MLVPTLVHKEKENGVPVRLVILLRRKLNRSLYHAYANFLSYQLWSSNRDLSFFSQLQIEACDGEFPTNQLCNKVEAEVKVRLNKEYEPTFDDLEWATDFTGNYVTAKVFVHFYVCLCIKVRN